MPGPIARARFIENVLEITSFDLCDDLWWRTDSEYGPITFFIQCSDSFGYACADAEEITEEDVDNLRKAVQDIREHNVSATWGPLLYVARKRNMQPLKELLKMMSDNERVLFEVLPENI